MNDHLKAALVLALVQKPRQVPKQLELPLGPTRSWWRRLFAALTEWP